MFGPATHAVNYSSFVTLCNSSHHSSEWINVANVACTVTIPLLRLVCDQIQSFMVTINLHLYIIYQHIDELKAIHLFWEKLTTDNQNLMS